MKIFNVTYYEKVTKTYTVEADTPEEAEALVTDVFTSNHDGVDQIFERGPVMTVEAILSDKEIAAIDWMPECVA